MNQSDISHLHNGLVALDQHTPGCSELTEPLIKLCDSLQQWNKQRNLTALSSTTDIIDLHILDSLTAAQGLSGMRIADVGTGAGFPGLPLALLFPDIQFTLVDAVAKKLQFVDHMALTLGLRNLTTWHGRVEQLPGEFDSIICRAFAPLPRMINWLDHKLTPQTRLLAMKAAWPAEEVAQMPEGFVVNAVIPLQIPGRTEQRQLLEIQRQALTQPTAAE